jgi:N,N'-diacetyllegionaminate synthase
MNAMLTLRDAFPYPVGYSDHTQGIVIPVMAVAMGATVIEKHFTLDRNMEGPDHKASLEPDELREMARSIRDIESARGDGIKRPTSSEMSTREVARKSIVAASDLSKGSVIKEGDLKVKRPGTGLAPKYLDELIGKTLTRDISEEELITLQDVSF